MSAANQQILTCYEDLHMSPEEISEDMGWEVESVKAILLQNSVVFRKSLEASVELAGGQPNLSVQVADESVNPHELPSLADRISIPELNTMLEAYKSLALGAETEAVRERALRNLLNEKCGRNNVKKIIQSDKTINIVTFNQRLIQAREASRRLLESMKPVVDVEAVPVK